MADNQAPAQVEASGRTVDDAVQRALKRLGLSRAEVDVEVLSEGRSGILGIGNANASVRVTARPGAAPASEQSRERPPLPRIDDYADPQELEPGERRGRRGPQRRVVNRPVDEDDGGAAQPDHRRRGRPREILNRPGRRDDRFAEQGDGRGDGRGNERREAPRAARPPAPRGPRSGGEPRERVRSEPRPPIPPFELLADPEFEPDSDPRVFATELLTDIIHLMGFDTIVEARDPETPMDGLNHSIAVLDVTPKPGDDLGLLIGRHGSHIAALQYVVNVILSHSLDGNNPVTVDIDGYKRRREEALEEIAQRTSAEVRDYGEPVELSPMPAAERRIIHLAIQDDPDLTTESIGDGPSRRVRIVYRDGG